MNDIDYNINHHTDDNLIKILDYLNRIEDYSKIIDDNISIKMLCYIRNVMYLTQNQINWNTFSEKNAQEIIAKLMLYFSNIFNELDFKNDTILITDLPEDSSINKKRICVFYYALGILNYTVSKSIDFNLKFNQSVGLKSLIDIVKIPNSIKKLKESNKNNLCVILLGSLNWLSKHCEESKKNWSDLNVVKILLKLFNSIPQSEFSIIYQIIANIANDKQIETLVEMEKTYDGLIELLKKSAFNLKNNNCTNQQAQLLDDNKIITLNLNYILDMSTNAIQSIAGVLNCFYKLSVNEQMRKKFYFDYKIQDYLKDILDFGNEIEIKYTLKIFAQMSFSNDISKELSKDSKITSFIGLKMNDESLKEICKQIEWNLEDHTLNEKNRKKTGLESKNDQVHIMISYNSSSRDLCLKIKSYLESLKLKVWMDISDIHGSSLDSMAKAVENSKCVLICITEKYRQSINCQAEAQYAFKLNKPIIPLIMQQGYENVNGWLGIIMGDKIFVNFTKYDYEECLRRLRKELLPYFKIFKQIKKNDSLSKDSPVVDKKNETPNSEQVEKWDTKRIKDWFVKNELNINIYEHLKPCNGLVLKQLYNMKNSAPEFFYQSLNKIDKVDLRSILIFSSSIDLVFNLKNKL